MTKKEEQIKNKKKDDALPYLYKSQYYEFGDYMRKLNDLFLKMELPYEEKKSYLDTIRELYNRCADETLTWEFIQTSLFIGSDIMDVLVAQAGSIGEAVKEGIALQYVYIQLAQWDKEEAEAKEKSN